MIRRSFFYYIKSIIKFLHYFFNLGFQFHFSILKLILNLSNYFQFFFYFLSAKYFNFKLSNFIILFNFNLLIILYSNLVIIFLINKILFFAFNLILIYFIDFLILWTCLVLKHSFLQLVLLFNSIIKFLNCFIN